MTGEKLAAKVVELHKAGKPAKEISKQLGISISRIDRILDRYRKRTP